MKGKLPCQSDLSLFEPHLMQVVDRGHPLAVFAETFPWGALESDYSGLYSDKGAPAKPIRLMAGLLILKQLFKGSDEGTLIEWCRDPYFQYICGGNVMTGKMPCSPSDLTYFRKRIGKERMSMLLELSADLQRKAGTGRLKVCDDMRPGQENFVYSVEAAPCNGFLKYISKLAGKFPMVFSGKARMH
jgi:transposase, IS5 family